jgi:transketolase
MVAPCLRAAEILAKEKIEAGVLNISSLKPLDGDALELAAKKTGAIVTAEEHSVIGGLGAAVCEAVAERHPVPIVRCGIEDQFGQSGTADELLDHYGLNAESLVKKAHQVLALKAR